MAGRSPLGLRVRGICWLYFLLQCACEDKMSKYMDDIEICRLYSYTNVIIV